LTAAGHVRRVSIRGREDGGATWDRPFLTLCRLSVANTFADGREGPAYRYDAVLRRSIDAVALLLTGRVGDRECVLLRSCVRPPLLLRESLSLPVPDPRRYDYLWELPAGLVEPGDRGTEGIAGRASTEAAEETGYRIPAEEFCLLPGAPFVTPGVLPERLHFAAARVVDPDDRSGAEGDGSPVEEGASVRWVPLDEALSMCERGEIEDMKTELGLRRLAALERESEE